MRHHITSEYIEYWRKRVLSRSWKFSD